LSSESTLPIVTITGIGALELASIHSFVQMSFHQHLKLSRPSISSNNTKSAEETRRDAAIASKTKNGENEGDSDSEEEEQEKAATAAPSRLRRFR
jgi:hypothetical protein